MGTIIIIAIGVVLGLFVFKNGKNILGIIAIVIVLAYLRYGLHADFIGPPPPAPIQRSTP